MEIHRIRFSSRALFLISNGALLNRDLPKTGYLGKQRRGPYPPLKKLTANAPKNKPTPLTGNNRLKQPSIFRCKIAVTLPKFNSSPLKSYRNPIGKDIVFQPPFFRGKLAVKLPGQKKFRDPVFLGCFSLVFQSYLLRWKVFLWYVFGVQSWHLLSFGVWKPNGFLARDFCSFPQTHRIHVWYIYLHVHEWLIFMVNVGKYTSPMDPSWGNPPSPKFNPVPRWKR